MLYKRARSVTKLSQKNAISSKDESNSKKTGEKTCQKNALFFEDFHPVENSRFQGGWNREKTFVALPKIHLRKKLSVEA